MAELRRHCLALASADRADQEHAKDSPRMWARRGPETDALCEAKVELANVQSQLDEARLQMRRELFEVQQEVEALETDNARLLQEGAGSTPSLHRSIIRLLSFGAEEPCRTPAEITTDPQSS